MAKENWVTHDPENCYNQQSCSGKRSQQSRRPPLAYQPVPTWEKKFCASVGAVPWHKIVETKKLLHLYEDIVKWNDSACEEVFNNAKERFWADMNGLPCSIKPPNPDMYLDEIDWSPKIDVDLVLDLEREPAVVVDGSERDGAIVNLGSPVDSSQTMGCSGWDDDEEERRDAERWNGAPRHIDCDRSWDEWRSKAVKENGWDSAWESDKCLDHHDGKEKLWDGSKDGDSKYHVAGNRRGRGLGRWRNNYSNRYASPAYHRDSYQVYRGCRYGREGKRVDYWL